MNKINIYDIVSVELTERGAERANTYYHTKPVNTPAENVANMSITYKKGDMLKVPLYVLMNIFGDWLYNGCIPLFKNDSIEF